MKGCCGVPKGLEGVLIAVLGRGEEADLKASKGEDVDERMGVVACPKALAVGDSTNGCCCCWANDANT